jgi:NAD(P)-dependent dehydrogenase (short-subunit alcohol dehydrogenase family)
VASPQGVTINNLLPGKFDTDRIATTLRAAAEKTGKTVDDVRRAQQAQIPAGRYGTPRSSAPSALSCAASRRLTSPGRTSCRTAAPIRGPIEAAGAAFALAAHWPQRRDETTIPPTISANASAW